MSVRSDRDGVSVRSEGRAMKMDTTGVIFRKAETYMCEILT